MDLSEFVEAVMPTVGERCPVTGGCDDWQDHICTGGTAEGQGRCVAHCTCKGDTDPEPLPPLTQTAVRALFMIIDCAQRGARVARLMPNGDVIEGTARHIVASADDFRFLRENGDVRENEDVRDGYLRVTTTGGFDVAWKVSELIEPALTGEFADRS